MFRRTLAAATPALAATLLLAWQTRTAPAAQMLGVVGAIAIVWLLAPLAQRFNNYVFRTVATVGIALLGLGAIVPFAMQAVPGNKSTPRDMAIGKANRLCNTMAAFRPVALQPKGMVFTFVDFGPRVITVTHHDSVIGPYHRNGRQIADVMNAFRGSEPQAHAIIAKYHSNYVLTCPNGSTTTIFISEAPNGFYAQLKNGRVPAWLAPVTLPANSPFKMWRVVG